MNYQYDCVNPRSLRELEFIIDNSEDIVYSTFVRNVNKDDLKILKERLGYSRSFPLKNDWHVSYHKSKLPNGNSVYYMCHSYIEYIFY